MRCSVFNELKTNLLVTIGNVDANDLLNHKNVHYEEGRGGTEYSHNTGTVGQKNNVLSKCTIFICAPPPILN